MAVAKYSIGIDLGTTNCAMAFTPLDNENALSEIFTIQQWESADLLAESDTLPSFLYLPTRQESSQLHADEPDRNPGWVTGRFARKRAGETPGRVAHSAKSWLGHHAVDRTAAFLPWGSEEISHDAKISPIHASALLLNYLRGAWDAKFPAKFDDQEITVTVPASFDAVAQQLTLDAASQAGFPKNVRLLEEPQAAFYRWLEAHRDTAALSAQLPLTVETAHHVLVIDVGGGTSDFSLFEISAQQGSALPSIRRIAVSDHILLGGDNIDLAIAHLIEPRFTNTREKLGGAQWDDLVARCRDLKEHCLAADGDPNQGFPLSLPGRGSDLFATTLSATITRSEISTILLDGFFPECPAGARPGTAGAALIEWGLPYASDSAVTKHLAAFLRDLPQVDAILFNGGSLHPEILRQRIRELIGNWQSDHIPQLLDNPEPALAVARGAARFGSILHHRSARIESGAARSIYLEIGGAGKDTPRSLVCILPRGATPGESHPIENLGIQLRVNRPVRIRTYYSTRHDKDKVGDIVTFRPNRFQKLPPLQTIAKLPEGTTAPEDDQLPVNLSASLTELGLLRLECISDVPGIVQKWPLSFNLRAGESQTAVSENEADPGVSPEALATATKRIVSLFSHHLDPKDHLTAARLLKSLGEILGLPKAQWNLFLVRALWSAIKRCFPCRTNSDDHEEAWLILAGFFLRPGFGAETDPVRIDDLWEIHTAGLAHPTKRIKLQQYILWRRVAGGLDRERQTAVLAPELEKIRTGKKPPAELIRMAGAFERIDPATKTELIHLFISRAGTLSEQGGYAAPYFDSLGLMLNRTPLHCGPEAVVPPDLVALAFAGFRDLDWKKSPEITDLFLRSARVTDNRALDLPAPLRKEIARKLQKAGAPPFKISRVEEYVTMDRTERAGLYGESLPPGLTLAGDNEP